MLRERPELFYPAVPQHYSSWQASSSSFTQYQLSSQHHYAAGYVKGLNATLISHSEGVAHASIMGYRARWATKFNVDEHATYYYSGN